MKQIKIMIGLVDNHPTFLKTFVLSLMNVYNTFQRWAMAQKDVEYVLDILMADYGFIDDMRNNLANQAIEGKYDYIFWMDTDMAFPNDCLIRMLQYCELDGHEAVTGLYTYKVPPYQPHIYRSLDKETGKYMLPVNFPLKEPFTVEGAGFGCLLMKTSVFSRLEKPYFEMKVEDGKLTKGEDLSFCIKADMDMILDPNIQCGHMQNTTFGIKDFLSYNNIVPSEDDWIRPTPEQRQHVLDGLEKMFPKSNH